MAVYITRTENINRFFNDIRNAKVMTQAEEASAFARVAEGDEKAVEEILKANMRFVVNRAKSYSNSEDRVSDFIQLGAMGMLDAIHRFDITKGYKFISFAVYYINLYITKGIDKLEIVRQSNDKKIAPKVRKIRDTFMQLNEREPSEWEIKEILETEYAIEVKDIRDITTLSVAHLDKEMGEEDCTALDCGEIATRTANLNEIERDIDNEDNAYKCKVLMRKLTEREREVICYSFGLNGYPMLDKEVIGEKLGLGAERVRQIREGAIKKMRG